MRDAKCKTCGLVFTIAYFLEDREYECPSCTSTDIVIGRFHTGQDFGPGDEWKENVFS
jgi:predicted Zn-ribbon and HTH transcriptional regulator